MFCDYALISSDGKLSIVGEFDQLNSTNEKPVLAKGFVVGSFEGEFGKMVEVEVSFIDEKNNNVLPKRTLKLTFGPGGRANILMGLENIVFNSQGKYRVVFRSSGNEVGSAYLNVVKINRNVEKRGSESVN